MVNEKVLVRDKHRKTKKISKVFIILILIILTIVIILLIGYNLKKSTNKITLENPLKNIVFANTNEEGLVDKQKVVEQAIIEFNAEYINYLIVALGINNLHKSYIGYGNPVIEMNIDNQVWSSEISSKTLNTIPSSNPDKDLVITMSKQEAIEGLLSSDITSFMKSSVSNGNTRIEMISNKAELASKGYLAMYKEITGEEAPIKE